MYHAGQRPIIQFASTYFAGPEGVGGGGYAPVFNSERKAQTQLTEQPKRGLENLPCYILQGKEVSSTRAGW